MTTKQMEYYLANYFDWGRNVIVPNVSWGLWYDWRYGGYEKDLFIVSNCGYATEVEIKISKSDLAKDKHKRNSMHSDDRIRYLYFAIPDYLLNYLLDRCDVLIPSQAGILTVSDDGEVKKIKKATVKSKYKLTDAEKFKVAKLGTMRIWNLKKKIMEMNKDLDETHDSYAGCGFADELDKEREYDLYNES